MLLYTHTHTYPNSCNHDEASVPNYSNEELFRLLCTIIYQITSPFILMISLIFKARANPCANLRVHYRNEYLSILVLGGDRGKPPFKFQQPVIIIYLAVRDDIIWGLVGETVKETNYLRVSNTILFELTTDKQKRS